MREHRDDRIGSLEDAYQSFDALVREVQKNGDAAALSTTLGSFIEFATATVTLTYARWAAGGGKESSRLDIEVQSASTMADAVATAVTKARAAYEAMRHHG